MGTLKWSTTESQESNQFLTGSLVNRISKLDGTCHMYKKLGLVHTGTDLEERRVKRVRTMACLGAKDVMHPFGNKLHVSARLLHVPHLLTQGLFDHGSDISVPIVLRLKKKQPTQVIN